MSKKETIIISACLLGINCRYNAERFEDIESYLDLSKKYNLIPLCPEQLGGLATPRPPAWFQKGTGEKTIKGNAYLINQEGKDVTKNFLHGAEETLRIAKLFNIKCAVLKERSPSCGVKNVWLGKDLVKGFGVTAAILKQNGIKIVSSDDMNFCD